MNLQVEQLHPLVLNVGLAIHNADWNWKTSTARLHDYIMSRKVQPKSNFPTGYIPYIPITCISYQPLRCTLISAIHISSIITCIFMRTTTRKMTGWSAGSFP